MFCFDWSGNKIAQQMRYIYDSGKLSSVKQGSILYNHELFEKSHFLYEITIEDYATWIIDQMMNHEKHDGVIYQGNIVLELLAPQHITPKSISNKMFDWVTSEKRGDFVDILKYTVIICAVSKDLPKCQLICEALIRNMNFDAQKLKSGRKIFPYLLQKRWEALRIMTQSEKLGGTICDKLTNTDGIKLLSWALGHYQTHPEDSVSVGHLLYICEEISSSEDKLNRLLDSSEFISQLKSFLPNRLQAAGKGRKIVNEKDVMKTQMGIVMQEYAELIIDLAMSKEFQTKFRDLSFFTLFQSSLQVLKEIPEWEPFVDSLEAIIYTILFITLYQMDDMEFTLSCIHSLKEELLDKAKRFKNTSSQLHWWCRRCLLQHQSPMIEFVTRLEKSSSSNPEVDAAIQIARQILVESEKEKGRSSAGVLGKKPLQPSGLESRSEDGMEKTVGWI